jgi:hypothetical protein
MGMWVWGVGGGWVWIWVCRCGMGGAFHHNQSIDQSSSHTHTSPPPCPPLNKPTPTKRTPTTQPPNQYRLILDELNLAPPEVLEGLNRLLDDNRELLIPETQVRVCALCALRSHSACALRSVCSAHTLCLRSHSVCALCVDVGVGRRHTNMYVCIHTCMYAYIHTHIHTYTQALIL